MAPSRQDSIEAREAKYRIQGEGLAVAGEKMLVGLKTLSGGGIDTNCGKAGVISSNSRRIKVCSAPKRTEEKAHR